MPGDREPMVVVRIKMPRWMYKTLRTRAEQRGVSVTEHIRRAVSLERMLFDDPDSTVTVRRSDGAEVGVRLEDADRG